MEAKSASGETSMALSTSTLAIPQPNLDPSGNSPSSDTASSPIWWPTSPSTSASGEHGSNPRPGHMRHTSSASSTGIAIARIMLEDHSTATDADDLYASGCWARSVSIHAPLVVTGPSAGGGGVGAGAYVVWRCTIGTLDARGAQVELRKRYSEFDALRTQLVRAFPHAAAAGIPDLPRKSIVSRFRPWFLEQRREGLEHFLRCVLLNPEFASSPVVREFVFC